MTRKGRPPPKAKGSEAGHPNLERMKAAPKHRILVAGGVLAVALVTVTLFRHKPSPPPAPPTATANLQDIHLPPAAPGANEFVRAELCEALGITGTGAPQRRIDLLASITGTLTPEECRAILGALLQPRAADAPEGWHAEYIHNLARLMQRAENSREEFARVLATLARDPRRGETVRDYALQHLRQVWDHSQDLRPRVEASFREFSTDPHMSASALLSLHLLGTPTSPGAEQTPARSYRIPDTEISPVVARILKEEPTADGMSARLTALRIVGDRRLTGFRDDLRRIASATKGEHALVRMAAVSNLARFADPADRAFLESLEARDPRVAHAVRRALATTR
jgi:hypothetical protein